MKRIRYFEVRFKYRNMNTEVNKILSYFGLRLDMDWRNIYLNKIESGLYVYYKG